jgi:soluble lytic murein transglycosylase-like protein
MANPQDLLSRLRSWRHLGHAGAIAALVVFAAVAALALRGGQHKPQAPAPHVRAATVVRKVPTVRKPAVVKTAAAKPTVHVPSDFEKEQAMSFGQLMNRWNPLIAEAARKYAVPQTWIRAVMEAESGGRTLLGENKPITSTAGAMGLMQLMPQTYDDMRRQYGLGRNPYDPHDNIMAGAAYLRFLRGKYPYPAMFAAYNDGPGNLEARLMSGGLLPTETDLYVAHITNTLENVRGGRGDARFTRPNGEAVMLNAAAVVSVRAAFPGEYAPGVQSVITVGRLHQGVRESVAQAKAILRAHGGGI